MPLNETSESAPETVQPETPETQTETKPAGEQPVSLAAALLGESEAKPGETQEKAEPQKGGADEALPKGLHALAEKLGASPEDLYSVEVPMADGKPVKLGELKDLYSKQEDVTRRELEIEERRTTAEAEATRAKQELETLMAQLPKEAIKPEVLERVRRERLETLSRERTATLEAIPEWADEGKRTEELKGIVEMLQGYGFDPRQLEQSLDSRLMRLARDSWLRKVRIERALAGVKKVEPTSTGKSGRAPPKETKSTSTYSSRAGNLRTLLNEG